MDDVGSIRRIITAQRADGESVVAVDEVVDPIVHPESGAACWPIYGREQVTELPHDGPVEYPLTFFPSTASGFRAHVIEFPAAGGSARVEGTGDEWPEFGLAEGRHVRPDAHGMHWTDTVDIVIVLSGEIGLAHDDGTEVVLRPGTIVVQNGANHAWRRRGVPCRMCFVNLAADRRGGTPLADSASDATRRTARN